MKAMRVAFAIGCCVTFILLAASTGGPAWVAWSYGDDIGSKGIFRYCIRILDGNTQCKTMKLTDKSNTARTIRASALLAVSFSIIGTVVAAIFIFNDKVKPIFGSAAMAVAGICAAIAGGLYTHEFGGFIAKDPFLSYGWSYILAWIGMVTAFASCFLGILLAIKKSHDYKRNASEFVPVPIWSELI